MIDVKNVEKFKFLAHKIIPLVYDESLSYYEFLCKVLYKMNEVIDAIDAQNDILESFEAEINEWEETTDEKYNNFVETVDNMFDTFANTLIGEYSATKSYYIGDYVRHVDKVYKATSNVTTEEWNPSHWTEVVYANDLKNTVDESFAAFANTIMPSYNSSSNYTKGDYVRYSNKTYKSNQNITAESWNPAHWTEVIYAKDLTNRFEDFAEDVESEINEFETTITNQQNAFEDDITGQMTQIREEWDEFFEQYLETLGVVQITGTSTTDVMSQNAVSKALFLNSDFATTIPDGTDFNTLVTPKTYKVSSWASGTTMINCPNANGGRLIVCETNQTNRVIQIYIPNSSDTIVYYRVEHASNTWGDWKILLTDKDVTQTTGSSNTKLMSQKAITDNIASSLYLNSDFAYTLDNGTDFNTLITPRTYKVTTFSSGSTMINSPNSNAGRLIVLQTSESQRIAQIYIPNSSDILVYYRIRYDSTHWSNWVHNLKTSDLAYVAEPKSIRVMQFNIGKFNYGNSGGLSTNVEEKIMNYKKFFGEYDADVACFEEFTEYIDSSQLYNTENTLFSEAYLSKSTMHGTSYEDENQFRSQYTLSNISDYHINNGEEVGGFFKQGRIFVNGRQIELITGSLRVLATAQSRYVAFNNLLTQKLANATYAIVCLDTNVISATEKTNILTCARNNGYTPANGGRFGDLNTLHSSSMYQPIDNIFVKGNIKIKNVFVPDVYNKLSSDHLPIFTDLVIGA